MTFSQLTLISVLVILMFGIFIIQTQLQNIPISTNEDRFKENIRKNDLI